MCPGISLVLCDCIRNLNVVGKYFERVSCKHVNAARAARHWNFECLNVFYK
jgi:hypothetical protein